jgi:hypothetical protein
VDERCMKERMKDFYFGDEDENENIKKIKMKSEEKK